MAIRNIVKIDKEKCNGCGECVTACAEGAIEIIDGKAQIVSDIYCDGLGACLGKCPRDAISIEKREADPFDSEAVESRLAGSEHSSGNPGQSAGTVPMCPGSMLHNFKRTPSPPESSNSHKGGSELGNWPVQLKLVPPNAPYLKDTDLLFVADCVPFALADFHKRVLRGNPVVIGCPKLDDASFYTDKLTTLLETSEIKSITVVHMEVPCCSALVRIVEEANSRSGKNIPVKDFTVTIQGDLQ